MAMRPCADVQTCILFIEQDSMSITYLPPAYAGRKCFQSCLCVCLSVFLSVQVITLEPLDIETSFLVCRYMLTISRSSLSIKVIGSRSYKKK